MKYCEYCGTALPDDSKFCTVCGNDVDTQIQPNQKNNKKIAIIIISLIVAALLIVGVIVAVKTVFSDSKEETRTEERRSDNEEENADKEEDTDDEREKIFGSSKDTDEEETTVEDDSAGMQDENSVSYPVVSMSEVESVTATSSLSEYNMTHYPERVVDGDISTGWVEGVSGQGENESITIHLNDKYTINGIRINAGFQKSSDLYNKNSRPSDIRITFSDGSSGVYSLQDKNGVQEIYLDEPVAADSVTFTILSVYAGNKYQDTVISEITLY